MTITQDDLLTFQKNKKLLKEKEEIMKLAKAKFDDFETSLIERVEGGEEVEEGKRRVQIITSERRSVAWKDVVVTLKGKAFIEERIQQATPVVSKKISISEA